MKLDRERSAGDRAGHSFCKWHRRAAPQCLHHRDPVHQPVVVVGLFRFISDPGMAEDFAEPVKAHNDGDVDTGMSL